MSGELAPALWGVPVVSGSSERAALFPAPPTNQRVHNLATDRMERFDGAAWVEALIGGGFTAIYNVKAAPYGALGDGSHDDTAAINQAVADALVGNGGVVYLPAGTYKTTSNIVISVSGSTPKALTVMGAPSATYIKPSAAVTTCLTLATENNSDGITNRLLVSGIYLDGVNTTGATGILVGENASNLSGLIALRDVDVFRFTGVGGKGLYVKNVVSCEYLRVYVARCYVNIYFLGSDTSLPTVQRFIDCQAREATTKGVQIERAFRIHWTGGVIESNAEEGIYCVPSGGANVLFCLFEGVWFEANYSVGNFHVKADGTGAGTVMLALKDCNFSGVAKSISFQKVINFTLDNIYPTNLAGSVAIDPGTANQSQGDIINWPQNNAPVATVLVNNSNQVGVSGPYSRGKLTMDSSGNLQVLSGNPNMGAVAARLGKIYATLLAHYYAQPAYSASITPDASAANFQQITVTDANAFTINNPTNAGNSMQLTIQIRNTSGGAMGAITWGSAFKLAGAFTNPATGNNRQIAFVYDPGNLKWYEVSRSAADVPN